MSVYPKHHHRSNHFSSRSGTPTA